MTYAYTYNGYSDPIENADHRYDRQLRRGSNEICKVDERLRAVLQITSA